MKSMPKIEEFMTKSLVTVEPHQTVKAVSELMEKRKIRHLPVYEKNRVIGIVSENNVKIGNLLPEGGNLQARDVMIPNLRTVTPDTPLDQVIVGMTEDKHDYVVVQEPTGKVLGIFTAIDALDVLVVQLRGQHWPIAQ